VQADDNPDTWQLVPYKLKVGGHVKMDQGGAKIKRLRPKKRCFHFPILIKLQLL
jgi:hypothetical protein